MAGDDEVIADDVVRISPDFTGFRAKAEAGLAKALKGVQAKIPVVADTKGFASELREKLAKVRQPKFKVALVADSRGFAASVREALARQKQPTMRVKLVADTRVDRDGIGRAVKGAQNEAKRASGGKPILDLFDPDLLKRQGDGLANAVKIRTNSIIGDLNRQRTEAEKIERDIGNARAAEDARNLRRTRTVDEELTRLRDRAVAERQREEQRVTETVRRETERRGRLAEQETSRRRSAFSKAATPPQIIDFGHRGIQPLNALYGIVIASTPALFAMASSAVQASTAVAALGSASIGAALGITGLVLSFGSITDALKLRQQTQNEATKTAADAAATAQQNALQQLTYQNNLTDALYDQVKAEKDLHTARLEAKRDLDDMKQKVIDLQAAERDDQVSVLEAEANARKVRANIFSTKLDIQRADADSATARAKLSGTKLDRKQAKEDLADGLKKGIEKSDKVTEAKDKVRRTRNRVAELKTTGADPAGKLTKTTSAASQLEQKLAEMSPAARDLYYWFDKNDETLKRLRRTIEQDTLPGFTRFLEAVNSRPKGGGKTTLQTAAEYAGQFGKITGDTVGKLGTITNTKWFRSSMAEIQKNNVTGYKILANAAVKLVKPLTQIFEVASPLFVAFAKRIDKWITRFADFIDKKYNDGGLVKWFMDAREAAGQWLSIFGNVLTLLKNLFMVSLPAGNTLVDRFEKFTRTMADWSSSANGQKQIADFFKIFADLPYGDIRDMLGEFIQTYLTVKSIQFAGRNPITTALLLMIRANPTAVANIAGSFNSIATGFLKFVNDHPQAIAAAIGLFGAAKVGKSVLGVGFTDGARNLLTGKFKILDKFLGGGAKTAVMNVQAGVVNVNSAVGGSLPGAGAAGAGAAGARPTGPPAPTTKYGKFAAGVKSLGLPFVPIPISEKNQSIADQLIKNSGKSKEQIDKDAKRSTAMKSGRDEALSWNRLVNNLSSFGKDSPVTKDAVNSYITDRQKHVKDYVAYVYSTQGPIAAAKAQTTEDEKSQVALSELLQQFGWTRAAAEVYTKQVFHVTGQTEKAKQAAQDASTKYDSLGNSLQTTGAKSDELKGKVDLLKGTVEATVGDKVINLSTKNYDAVKKQLDMLYAIQHVMYNPTYSNSAAGADTVSSQNQYLDPKTGLPKVYMKADGGYINGPGTWTSDSIPARLSNGEYVMPADKVRKYGVGTFEAFRSGAVPEYAQGGPVGNAFPFVVNLPTKGLQVPDVQSPSYTGVGGGTATGDENVAETAERTARALGATSKQLVALIEAGLVESGLRNLGGDRDSLGFLQQRPSQGWGTPKQIMDVAHATTAFIRTAKAMDSPKWDAGTLAWHVQRPATDLRYKYGTREADAVAVLNRNTPYLDGTSYGKPAPYLGGSVPPGYYDTKAGLIAFGRQLQARGYRVSENPAFGGVSPVHARGSQHYRGNAIDVNHGSGTSPEEQAYLRQIIPEAHKWGFRTIFMDPRLGHYDHAHIDLGPGHKQGGLVNARTYDSGGTLPPGYTLAFNGTGRNETIRTHTQEKNLNAPQRLDRRDIALLASQIARAASPQIDMDGRRVAEITNRHNYLPSGV